MTINDLITKYDIVPAVNNGRRVLRIYNQAKCDRDGAFDEIKKRRLKKRPQKPDSARSTRSPDWLRSKQQLLTLPHGTPILMQALMTAAGLASGRSRSTTWTRSTPCIQEQPLILRQKAGARQATTPKQARAKKLWIASSTESRKLRLSPTWSVSWTRTLQARFGTKGGSRNAGKNLRCIL